MSISCPSRSHGTQSSHVRLTPEQKDAGRALTGFGCGIITATVPSYIAELSIPSIRGILTGLFEITYQVGSLVGFWINYGINNTMDPKSSSSWRVPMAVQIPPAALLLVGAFVLHESPLWLLRKGKDEETYKALETLRRLPIDHQCMSFCARYALAADGRLTGTRRPPGGAPDDARKACGRGSHCEQVRNRHRGLHPWRDVRVLAEGNVQPHHSHLLRLCAPEHVGRRWYDPCSPLLLAVCGRLGTFADGSLLQAINYYSPTLFGSLGITDVALYTGIYGLVKGKHLTPCARGYAAAKRFAK